MNVFCEIDFPKKLQLSEMNVVDVSGILANKSQKFREINSLQKNFPLNELV